MHPYNFRAGGNILMRLFQPTCREVGLITCVQVGISKIWKVVDELQPLSRWPKETWWTLVHIPKSYRGAYWPTQVDVFQDTIFAALKGCCALKFLSALEIDQGYLAHTRTGTGSPPPKKKKNYSRKFKIWLKTGRLSLYNFHDSMNILTKFLQETWWTLVHKQN